MSLSAPQALTMSHNEWTKRDEWAARQIDVLYRPKEKLWEVQINGQQVGLYVMERRARRAAREYEESEG